MYTKDTPQVNFPPVENPDLLSLAVISANLWFVLPMACAIWGYSQFLPRPGTTQAPKAK